MKYMFHNYFKRYKTYYEVNKGKIFDEENKKLNKQFKLRGKKCLSFFLKNFS